MVGVYYSVYKETTVNVCALTSTWLTVVMAIGRYVVVCRPLHARGYISLRGTKASIAAVLILSILLNVPRMLRHDIISSSCSDFGAHPTASIPPDCHCVIYMKVRRCSMFSFLIFA